MADDLAAAGGHPAMGQLIELLEGARSHARKHILEPGERFDSGEFAGGHDDNGPV